MNTKTPLDLAIDDLGLTALAQRCGVTYQAVRKWRTAGRMPRTEWTGETSYCGVIEQATEGKVTRQMLLDKWPQPPSVSSAAAHPKVQQPAAA